MELGLAQLAGQRVHLLNAGQVEDLSDVAGVADSVGLLQAVDRVGGHNAVEGVQRQVVGRLHGGAVDLGQQGTQRTLKNVAQLIWQLRATGR